MKILDLVDTSSAATKHLQASGTLPITIGGGTLPMTRANVSGELDPGDAVMQRFTMSYPTSGGIQLNMIMSSKYSSTIFQSGLLYRIEHLDEGLMGRNTQLNLTYTYQYTATTTGPVQAGWGDVSVVLVSPLGRLTNLSLGSAYTLTSSKVGEAIKVEVIIDRSRKVIEMIALNLVTGKTARTTTYYSNYNTLVPYGVMIGIHGYSNGQRYEYYTAFVNSYMLLENILLTENDRDHDPRRHGSFNLATLSDVVKADHPSATLLNKARPVTAIHADRYKDQPSIPVKGDSPVVLMLRPTLMSDEALSNKGTCVALVVTADMKSVTGRYQYLGKVSSGRTTALSVPRTEPYTQLVGNAGIGAHIGQIDIRHASGIDMPAVTVAKTITLSVK